MCREADSVQECVYGTSGGVGSRFDAVNPLNVDVNTSCECPCYASANIESCTTTFLG